MLKSTTLALILSASAALAEASSDQLLANVSRELPHYVSGVDASTLSRSKLAHIYSIMHDGRSESDKRKMIRSVLGGRHSLRGLLFNSN